MSRYVLSVDPGKATGVALLKLEDGEEPFIVYSGEAQPFEFAEMLDFFLAVLTEISTT